MAKVEDLSQYNLEALHSAVSAGEPLNREVIETFKKHFHITVRDGYGQTENTLLVGVMKGMDIRPGSMGKPTPGNHVDIVNEEGTPVKVGEVGDIAVHIETPTSLNNITKTMNVQRCNSAVIIILQGIKRRKMKTATSGLKGAVMISLLVLVIQSGSLK